MSASLVGSEMCIRDRPSALRYALDGQAAAGRQPAEDAGVQLAEEGKHGAVSYTHLTLPTICSV
eukprot:7172832-Alexandrium_andersonii.AAC.1